MVKEFKNTGNPLTGTTEKVKPATVKPLSMDTTDGVITIDVPYSISTEQNDPVLDFINMNILVGSYDYTLTLSGDSERATVMHGKFKIIN